jgi:cystathionine gamma-synthase
VSAVSGHDDGTRGLDPATVAVHAGRGRARGAPLMPPAVLASVYQAGEGPAYAREGNPTWAAFERAVAALEGAAEAVAFSSGMAAASALIGTLDARARVVVARTAHVEVRAELAEVDATGRIEVELADAGDPERFGAALAGADLAWIDSLANPTLEVAEVDAIAAEARGAGAGLVVDATLATPILQRPLELGASAVLHSAGKFLGGHSDLLLGVVATNDARLAKSLRRRRERAGATPGTFEAWLAVRGMRTLALRIGQGQASAAALAARLRRHPDVTRVWFPGLANPPRRLLAGPGPMLSFGVAGGPRRADALCEALELIVHAGSLGGVESLMERHARWHREPAIPAELLRLSVGCEHPDDLWHDLSRALARTRPRGRSRSVSRSREPAPAA